MPRDDYAWTPLSHHAISQLSGDANAIAVYSTLVSRAYQEESVYVLRDGTSVVLPPGSVIFSIRELANFVGLKKDAVSRALIRLFRHDTLRDRRHDTSWENASCCMVVFLFEKNKHKLKNKNHGTTGHETESATYKEEERIKKEKKKNTNARSARCAPSDWNTDPNKYSQEFEKFYAAFPRKVGKRCGARAFAKLSEAERIRAAEGLRRFVIAMQAEGRPEDKLPHFSTFMNQRYWDDYADWEPPKQKNDWNPDEATWR